MSSVIENELSGWVWSMWQDEVCISDALIRSKEYRLQRELNISVPSELCTNHDISNVWLFKFERRNHFKSYRCHGDEGGADEEAIQREPPVLLQHLSSFCVNDVFNADEFGLFYRQLPNTTIGPSRLRGRKKRKDGLKFLTCCQGDGTERLLSLVVGYSRRPGCFRRHNVALDGIEYCNRKKLG